MNDELYDSFLAAMEKGTVHTHLDSLHTSSNVSAAAIDAFSKSWQTHPVPHASASFLLPVVKPIRLVYVKSGVRKHLTLAGNDPMNVSMVANHTPGKEPSSLFELPLPGTIDITLSMRVNTYTFETIETK